MSVCVFIDYICHILYYFNLKQQNFIQHEPIQHGYKSYCITTSTANLYIVIFLHFFQETDDFGRFHHVQGKNILLLSFVRLIVY